MAMEKQYKRQLAIIKKIKHNKINQWFEKFRTWNHFNTVKNTFKQIM